ncbi:Mitogen-activated protein kinase kinase kinase 19,Mitogen-activated protein kinase kinase kinase 3,Mitogen-activated protein kinase kinase kinase 2,Mitogen-activated protein kinase kinase kinase NPK1,MAP3K epsilon protein kinase 1,Mitogen-activated protein kinase kinase kinase ANP1,Mitogen-activated protein kinase kinase kinase 1,Mitogen-activated protein kinase kinase kinase nsy-1,Cytokinesis protein sepH,Serine/threonine-protein kinase sepA,Mitogen-activated protein kinase kinase kinase YODA,Mitogen-acti|uniref:Mitogen-activated protein kinase kinase kinase 19 n=1 Tax=Mytilus coruscus TaxID=42192 RepID=A0A6J8D8M9_MYTCO|nr:Mitogen-activated protein kinase kinase kinase 19,Mitogen-activated protein kinase kinase kinase 3,Mitogen-activated protein kinase kinase kinase 2,Mitogen-activated protein kinase kinase kinase NPK1,MAP3K epsilon protein kinase 1,Mitogen-activated protein kinase kinase kinase ANP1,Mitogen-activated protein kinase kinase kinase 1,Mitogen-activated protein kinase kinase kinase nsy-1,Cytokinesis protein sepH,Serine/threonine-protein kinase sepA,Mitogen-activated protein kinase kinase kinase YODA,M
MPELPENEQRPKSRNGSASKRTELHNSLNNQLNTTRKRIGSATYYDIASTLLGQGRTADLEEIFLSAARDGDYEKIENFLQRRSDCIVSVDVKDKRTGNTPLIWASKRGHTKIVQLLLKHGADVTLRNYENQTAVDVASSAIKTVLLDSVERTTESWHHLLLQAAWQGNIKVVRKLLNENKVRDINCCNSEGLTPLLLATRDMVMLEKLCTQLNKPYHPAEVVAELLRYRCDIHAADGDGKTCLHYASQSKAIISPMVVQTIITAGPDIELQDKRLFAPIHCASQTGNVDTIDTLIQGGSSVNSRGFAGTTPLHITAYNDHEKAASCLLSYGAQVMLTDDRGLTSLDLARGKKMKATLKEAWIEATRGKPVVDLAPIRAPSREEVKASIEKFDSKRKGEVIFDAHPSNPFANMQSTPHRGQPVSRHLSLKEKASRAEALMNKDIESGRFSPSPYAKDGPRRLGLVRGGRKPSPLPRVNSKERHPSVSPDRLSNGGRESPAFNRNGRFRKSFDEGRLITHPSPGSRFNKDSGINTPTEDLDNCLQNSRITPVSPSPSLSKKKHKRSGSDTATSVKVGHVAASCDPIMAQKGRVSHPLSRSDDFTSSPYLIRVKPAQTREDNKHKTNTHAVVLDLERMGLVNKCQTPVQGAPVCPTSSKVLPPTPTCTNENSCLESKTINREDTDSSKEASPRSDDECPNLGGEIKQAFSSTLTLLRAKTKYKEDFVLEESRPKDLKELLILQSSGSEESNYGSISSRSSDSSKENNGQPYKKVNNLKPVPQKQQDLKKNIRNFPKDGKKFQLRPNNNKVLESTSKKNIDVLKTRYDTPPVGQAVNSDKVIVHSNNLLNSEINSARKETMGNSNAQNQEKHQGQSLASVSKESKTSVKQSSQSKSGQGQVDFQGQRQRTSISGRLENDGEKPAIKSNTISTTVSSNAIVKLGTKPGSSKPMQVVSNKLISNVRDEVQRQKSAKQSEQDTVADRKNSAKNSSLTNSIKQMINVAKSVVVPNSGKSKQKNSAVSKSVDSGPLVTTENKQTPAIPSEFLRTGSGSGKTVYTDITNNSVSLTPDIGGKNNSNTKNSVTDKVTQNTTNSSTLSGNKVTNTKPENNQSKRPLHQSVGKISGANSSKNISNTAVSKSVTKVSSPATSRKNSPSQQNNVSAKISSSPLIIKSASMSTIQESNNDKSVNLKSQSNSNVTKSESDSNIKAKIEEQEPANFKYKPASAGKPPLVEILPSDTPRSKRTQGVFINPLEPVATPIIVNPFEQFDKPTGISATEYGFVVQKPGIERSKTQTSIRSRGKSAKKSGKDGKPGSATSSRTGGKRKVLKNKEGKNSDDGNNRPKSGKPKRRIKSGKRRKKSATDSVLTKQSEQSDIALISGIGWHVATSCYDKSDVAAIQRIGSDSSESSESDDLDMPTPRHYRPLHIETSNLAELPAHSPRFLEVKQREQQRNENIPVLDNDGYPPMNLDVTQKSLPSAFDIENFLKNLNQEAGSEMNFDQAIKNLAIIPQDIDYDPDYVNSPEVDEQTAALHRQILMGKLTPIPESPSIKSSHVLKTTEAIQNFDQKVKEEALNQLLGLNSDRNNNKGLEDVVNDVHNVKKSAGNMVRNSATDIALGNTLNASPKQTNSQPPSGKSSGRRRIERTPSSEKRGHNLASRSSSNTSVKDKNNSASRLNSRNESGNSNGRVSRQSSSDIRRSSEAINESEKRKSREAINEVGKSSEVKILKEEFVNERESSEECLLDAKGNISSRRERKFSESKSDQPEDENNIDTVIEEILNNNTYMSTSSIRSTGSFRLSNRTDTITPADRQLLLRMTAEADNSPFHAGRLAESFTPRGNQMFDHDEKNRLAESFTPRANKGENNFRKPILTGSSSHPHLNQSVDLEAKQTMAKILNSFKKMEMYVGDHKRETRKDVTKPEISSSVPTSAVRVSVRPGTPSKVRSAGKFTEIKKEKMTPRADEGRVVKSSTRLEDSRAVKSSSHNVKSSSHKKSFIRQSVEPSIQVELPVIPVSGGDFDEEDLLIPDNETIVSHLSSSDSRSGSACTVFSQTEETIQWKKGNVLGKGAFGTVWCGLTNEGQLIAVKQIELNTMDQDKAKREYEKVQEEVELLKTLNHKNIVGYLGTSLEENIVSIFMQFVPGGSIASILARFGALDEAVFRKYTKQILEGVEYLHSNDVIHRDIKGGNVMLMPNGIIKLIDFGCAKRLCINLSMGQSQILKSMKGTPYWMAPEVVNETGHGKKSDIWSVGCTVFEMATRKPPWSDMNPMAAIFAIGCDRPVPELPERFTLEARDFVNSCLTRDQSKRLSATQLLHHEFLIRRRHSTKK